MDESKIYPIKRADKKFRVERPTQTGFSSPATHYNEPRIDLNEALVTNSSSTFFVRIKDEAFEEHNINDGDVLIVDKSLTPKNDQLAMAAIDGSFLVVKIDSDSGSELNVWGTITHIIKSVI